MKKFFYPAIISFFIAGCSTTPTIEKNLNNTDAANIAAVNQATVNQAIVTQANQNGTVESPSNTSNAQMLPTARESAIESAKTKNPNANVAPIQAKPMVNSAPDNSEISSTMNKEGIPIETRIFRNNPRLVKVERIFIDVKNPQTKVYLKGGKVVDLPPGKLENVATASASEILNAIGVAPNIVPVKKRSETKN